MCGLRLTFFGYCVAMLCILLVTNAHAADEAAIKRSIARATAYLQKFGPAAPASETGLPVYAMLKGNVSSEDPAIERMLKKLLAKCTSTQYKPQGHGIYEAACDAMAFEALDPELYRSQLRVIAEYILKHQRAHGGWYYPDRELDVEMASDTSVTQYALLGLWAARRGGIDIPASAWDKAAQWHMGTQGSGGGHAYHPYGQANITQRKPRTTMTAAACGSLGIIEQNLFGNATGFNRSAEKKKDHGVLETRNIDDLLSEQERPILNEPIRTNVQQVKSTAKRAANWLDKEFEKLEYRRTLYANEHTWKYYLAYTIERMGALHDQKVVGGRDWYESGSAYLLKEQESGGSWKAQNRVIDTSFCILFLSRATSKLLNRNIGPSVGNGLLAGGRGLPEDLSAVQEINGEIKTKESLGDLDELLAELEKLDAGSIEMTQQAIVSKFSNADPETLIGNRDELLKLVRHEDPEARRTAIWALARCAKLDDYSVFVNALSDADIDVAVEARAALCWVSRKPLGFNDPETPAELLPEGVEASAASERQWQAAFKAWRQQVIPLWKQWHQGIRPYEERDKLDDPRFD